MKSNNQKKLIKEKVSKITNSLLIGKYKSGNIEIELIDFYEIEGGIECLVRGWKDDEQLGFGENGIVEIERVKIYNPPILKYNESGDIVEEPASAIIDSLIHTVSVIGKNGNIKIGKVGNTTSTFYPAAGANSPADGWAYTSDGPFTTLRDGDGETFSATSATEIFAGLSTNPTGSNYSQLRRSMYGFDTSTLGSTQIISSATISFVGYSSIDYSIPSQKAMVAKGYLTNTNNVVDADYQLNKDGAKASDTEIDCSAWSIGSYNGFTLNSAGIAHIDKNGVSIFCGRLKCDIDNAEPTWAGNSRAARVRTYYADQSGTSLDPVLIVEHVTVLTSTLTDGIKVGDVITAFKIVISSIIDGLKLGDVISTSRAKTSTLIDGLKLGDIFSSAFEWTRRTKPSTTFTNRTKPTTSFTDRTKPTTTWTKHDKY